MKTPNQQHFAVVPSVNINRSRFDRTSRYMTTFDLDWLVPFYVDEVLPGDSFNVKVTHFGRLATPIKPIMDNIYIDIFFFFVPNRLVWDNWVKLQGEQEDPDDTINYSVPEMTAPAVTGYTIGSIYDYMGLPTGIVGYKHSALPLRAYNLIYNNWFRHQLIQDSLVVDKDDADSDVGDYVLKKRTKRADYFTSGLPEPQKGADVLLPLGDFAPVIGLGKQNADWEASLNIAVKETPHTDRTYVNAQVINPGSQDTSFYVEEGSGAGVGYPNIRVDLSEATASSINDLREAFQIQRLLERDERSGTRYPEILRAQYGVVDPSYAVLQRPVYLGGGRSRLNVTPIPQQNATGVTGTPQGNLAGMGTTSGQSGFVKSFTEHGLIIGIMCAVGELTYQQGLERFWSKSTRYDFYLPVFANLGEQAILTKELMCKDPTVDTGATGTPDNEKIFAYQERWGEYRYKPSKITGLFRSSAAGTLHSWHLAEEFTGLPTLDSTFIEYNSPIDRCIAVPAEPHIIMDMVIDNITTRPMPVYSVPGLIDHL